MNTQAEKKERKEKKIQREIFPLATILAALLSENRITTLPQAL